MAVARGADNGADDRLLVQPDKGSPDSSGRRPRHETLAAPVSDKDIQKGIRRKDRRAVEEAEQRLQRRLADAELVERLRRNGFAGPEYESFQGEIAAYGLGVMGSWLHSSHAFWMAKSRGFALNPTEHALEILATTADSRNELSTMTVARSLPKFRAQALLGGRWRADGGASLTTYFMGACVFTFPNEYRRWWGEQELWRKQAQSDVRTSLNEYGIDAAVVAVGQVRVREHLDGLAPRRRTVIAMTLDGYSQAEIAEALGLTVRAVEGVVYRWRTNEQSALREEG